MDHSIKKNKIRALLQKYGSIYRYWDKKHKKGKKKTKLFEILTR